MNVTVSSTTDSAEDVLAATGASKAEAVSEEKESAPADKAGESEESDPSKSNSDEEDDSSEDQENSDDEGKAKEGEGKPKPKNGVQKRINKLNSRISERDQLLAAKDREIELLRAQSSKGKQEQEEQPTTTKAAAEGKPNPNNFTEHDDYLEALTDWKVDQREKAREAKAKETEIKTEFQKKGDELRSSIEEFKKSHDDFDDLIADVNDIHLTPGHQEAIFTSKHAPALMYELANNREELERISKMSLFEAAREIGKIELRLSKDSPDKKEVKQTKAPPPITPVGSKSSGRAAKSPDEMSFQEYKKWRENQ